MRRINLQRLGMGVIMVQQCIFVSGFVCRSYHSPIQVVSTTPMEVLLSRSCSTRRYTSLDNESTTERTEEAKNLRNDGSVALQQLEAELESEEDYVVAIKRTLLWVAAATAFGVSLSYFDNPTTSEEFFAGYLLEQSLSIDNLLVFLLLFEYFRIPTAYQNRILNWGIIGAVVMRAIMIGAGAVAIREFHAVLLGFAAVLIYSSGKILIGGDDDEDEDFSDNMIVKLSNTLVKSTNDFEGDRFFKEVDGVRLATPMFLCMIAVELSDVIFAVDSIPAVFGVTENPLVVFSSNMFAILGLRSLYSILSKAASELKYLEPAVAIVLGFIGTKMILEFFGILVPTEFSLAIVATLLGGGVFASVIDSSDEVVSGLESDENRNS